MIRRPPRSTQSRSSAASDVYKRQPAQQPLHEDLLDKVVGVLVYVREAAYPVAGQVRGREEEPFRFRLLAGVVSLRDRVGRRPDHGVVNRVLYALPEQVHACLLYTSDAADDLLCVDLGGRRIIKKKKKKKNTQ